MASPEPDALTAYVNRKEDIIRSLSAEEVGAGLRVIATELLEQNKANTKSFVGYLLMWEAARRIDPEHHVAFPTD